jgi:hypothetical protein
LETRREVVDPPTRPLAEFGDDFEKAIDERGWAVSCCAVAKTRLSLFASSSDQSHRLDEEKSRPHARQDRQASLGADLWRAGRDQKSPVRRCFKPRPPFGGVRRFASGCQSSKGG